MAHKAAFVCVVALAFAGRAYGQTDAGPTDAQVAARLTPTVHACEHSPDNGGTLQQALCYRDEASRQDRRLNKTWTEVMRRVSPKRRQALRVSERQWIKERDEDCRDDADGYINSTAAYMFNVCVTNETIRRTIWLESTH